MFLRRYILEDIVEKINRDQNYLRIDPNCFANIETIIFYPDSFAQIGVCIANRNPRYLKVLDKKRKLKFVIQTNEVIFVM